jgi:hypothetical protein
MVTWIAPKMWVIVRFTGYIHSSSPPVTGPEVDESHIRAEPESPSVIPIEMKRL